ncbi:DUF6445 family protein [Catenovulum sp. 2E275]|uniref:DUF6445 family protein n=1 Tax=Catenovulum sp. 2E275 TaxID=2980497 RepID=UPI0021D35C32|nr:DUF6445 family protein [Catenovulum sp. 2E275]MCU4677109.1 DUF6445 family protein [Catenovulum sp. 2E275]
MQLTLSDTINIQIEQFGDEQTPILIIDNFIQQSHELVRFACKQTFSRQSQFYPGVRAPAPAHYQTILLTTIAPYLTDIFNFSSTNIKISQSQFSLVTQPPHNLHLLQRIPHFDSTQSQSLATVHYLSKTEQGGTGFYRHKKTGFERITEQRLTAYLKSLEAENGTANMPKKQDGYINGDTPLFQRIFKQTAVFNRILVYPKNVLHSGNIPNSFVPDLNPANGRLTINTFIDCI